jgi:hypothetical protein
MQYITATQYAKRHRISRQAVNKRIKTGKIKAKKVGFYYIIKIK